MYINSNVIKIFITIITYKINPYLFIIIHTYYFIFMKNTKFVLNRTTVDIKLSVFFITKKL